MAQKSTGVRERLEQLRREILAERISYGEIAELQSLARFIDPDDVLLLEWAGVPEKRARVKRNPKKHITGSTPVWTASGWWHDNDPFVFVVALTQARAEQAIQRAMKDQAADARDDGTYESMGAALNDMGWSGVFPSTLKRVVDARELPEALRELTDNGVFYPQP